MHLHFEHQNPPGSPGWHWKFSVWWLIAGEAQRNPRPWKVRLSPENQPPLSWLHPENGLETRIRSEISSDSLAIHKPLKWVDTNRCKWLNRTFHGRGLRWASPAISICHQTLNFQCQPGEPGGFWCSKCKSTGFFGGWFSGGLCPCARVPVDRGCARVPVCPWIGVVPVCPWIGVVPGCPGQRQVQKFRSDTLAGSCNCRQSVPGSYGRCKGPCLINIIIFLSLNVIIRHLIFRRIMILHWMSLHWMSRNIVILVIPLLNQYSSSTSSSSSFSMSWSSTFSSSTSIILIIHKTKACRTNIISQCFFVFRVWTLFQSVFSDQSTWMPRIASLQPPCLYRGTASLKKSNAIIPWNSVDSGTSHGYHAPT